MNVGLIRHLYKLRLNTFSFLTNPIFILLNGHTQKENGNTHKYIRSNYPNFVFSIIRFYEQKSGVNTHFITIYHHFHFPCCTWKSLLILYLYGPTTAYRCLEKTPNLLEFDLKSTLPFSSHRTSGLQERPPFMLD